MQQLNIIKIGGNVIDDEKQLKLFIADFSKIKGKKILVHGGGKIATETGKKLGIEAKMLDGRRITDADTLKVVIMVYAGLINKNIVAQLQAKKCNAIGLTGADGNLIPAKRRKVKDIDYGFVGDIAHRQLPIANYQLLIDNNFTPVFCALTHDGKGNLLNTNADTIASVLSVGLSKYYNVNLVYCFEKTGVLRDINNDGSLIENISSREYLKLKKENIISGGMIPKLDNSFDAISKGVKYVYICQAGNILKVFNKNFVLRTRLSK